MPKVGIMADVSEDVFENVVSPAKAEKRFNKLVSSLLEAYYTNNSVRSVVDGQEELDRLEGISTLQEQLNQASHSLNTMGIYEESLQMSLDSAKDDFTAISEGDKVETGVSRDDDLERFKKDILESQKSFMEEMKSLFSTVVEDISKPKEVRNYSEPIKSSKPTESSKEESTVNLSDQFDIYEDDDEPLVFEVIKEDVSKSVSGDDVLKNLLGNNNSISFGG